ncbi:hypothetical protein L596_022556 [Steinernema carpocapsae]|nr:hypothetical protein L596_022556 [Steinernema carpocapsae]
MHLSVVLLIFTLALFCSSANVFEPFHSQDVEDANIASKQIQFKLQEPKNVTKNALEWKEATVLELVGLFYNFSEACLEDQTMVCLCMSNVINERRLKRRVQHSNLCPADTFHLCLFKRSDSEHLLIKSNSLHDTHSEKSVHINVHFRKDIRINTSRKASSSMMFQFEFDAEDDPGEEATTTTFQKTTTSIVSRSQLISFNVRLVTNNPSCRTSFLLGDQNVAREVLKSIYARKLETLTKQNGIQVQDGYLFFAVILMALLNM